MSPTSEKSPNQTYTANWLRRIGAVAGLSIVATISGIYAPVDTTPDPAPTKEPIPGVPYMASEEQLAEARALWQQYQADNAAKSTETTVGSVDTSIASESTKSAK